MSIANVEDRERSTPGKKDRKRWCGGHVGRDHMPTCVPDRRMPLLWRVLACSRCGRGLDRYTPWPPDWRREDGRSLSEVLPVLKPAWVTS